METNLDLKIDYSSNIEELNVPISGVKILTIDNVDKLKNMIDPFRDGLICFDFKDNIHYRYNSQIDLWIEIPDIILNSVLDTNNLQILYLNDEYENYVPQKKEPQKEYNMTKYEYDYIIGKIDSIEKKQEDIFEGLNFLIKLFSSAKQQVTSKLSLEEFQTYMVTNFKDMAESFQGKKLSEIRLMLNEYTGLNIQEDISVEEMFYLYKQELEKIRGN